MPSTPPTPVISLRHTAHLRWTYQHAHKLGPPSFIQGIAERHESLWPGVWKLSLWPGRGGFVITELLGIGLLTGEACRGGGGVGADCQKDYPPLPHTTSFCPNNYYLDCINCANRCTQKAWKQVGVIWSSPQEHTKKHTRAQSNTRGFGFRLPPFFLC